MKAESPNSVSQKKDGLCEDTEKRFTYPRRGRPENELLLQADEKSLSTSETGQKSAVPLGFSVITCFEEKGVKDKEIKSEVQVHSAQRGIPKEKVKDKDSSSDSSSDSDNDEKQPNGAKHLIKRSAKRRENGKRVQSFVHRTRSKSLHNSIEDIPEYSKPMKRSVSNPSVVAREEMLQRDERFRSLEAWRATIPIPEPDYPNVISSARLIEEEDQDNAPPSYATSDSGVECLDALSAHDDESINHCDSVPESPGLPSQLKHESSFSSFKETRYKERTEMRFQESNHTRHTNGPDHGINGLQDNAMVVTSKDHTALIDIDANAVKESPSSFGVNQQALFFQSTPMENKPREASLPYSDPKLALRSTTKPASNSVSSSERKPTERIQTKDSEQIDFRSVKLRPTSKNYEENHSFMIYGSSTAVLPSSEKEKEQPTSLEQQKPKNQDLASPLSSGETIVINNATDKAKDRYLLPKTHAIEAEKNVTKIKSLDTNKGNDFQRIHLRQTPQSVKQHIGFREDMMSQAFKDTQTQEENTTSDKTDKESEKVIGVLDGIKRFQSQGVQVPKPMYGSHYVSKKEPDQKPASIISQEPTANSKPVSIVAPEPSFRETTHKTTTTTSRNTRDIIVTKNENVHKNEKTRPVSVIKDPVVSEDKRHYRYSTGNVNQSHVSMGFKDAPKKTITVIRGLDEEENRNTTSNKQDSLEKPVAVVPPQSPKGKRETAEERAAFEEERKKNWKREQIEHKLTSAHIRSVQNNKEQIMAGVWTSL